MTWKSQKMKEIETFVTVHNQDILLNCEATNQFGSLSSYKYLFVGYRPVDKLDPSLLAKTVLCREFIPNYEKYPHFYDFTGWNILWKNNLVEAKNVILLQYDMYILTPQIEEITLDFLNSAPGMLGNYWASKPMWLMSQSYEALSLALSAKGYDINQVANMFEDGWPSTQGTAWTTEHFYGFMEWFEPLFEIIKDYVFCGHAAERLANAYAVISGLARHNFPGAINHRFGNTHGTTALWQGQSKFNEGTYGEDMFSS